MKQNMSVESKGKGFQIPLPLTQIGLIWNEKTLCLERTKSFIDYAYVRCFVTDTSFVLWKYIFTFPKPYNTFKYGHQRVACALCIYLSVCVREKEKSVCNCVPNLIIHFFAIFVFLRWEFLYERSDSLYKEIIN